MKVLHSDFQWKRWMLALLILSFAFSSSKPVNEQISAIPIIPYPWKIQSRTGVFQIPDQIPIYTNQQFLSNEAQFLADELASLGFSAVLTSEQGLQQISLQVDPLIDSLGKEGYFLVVHDDGISIRSMDPAGVFYGVQSLLQLMPDKQHNSNIIPCVMVTDKPRFPWRGLHLDVCRHFFPVPFIKKYLDQMARYKLNTFHWHLTDDQGWRIEIKKYPLLTQFGSQRKETMVEKHFNPYIGDGIEYGGYFTQEDVQEIVSYAAQRHIQVVPEIEMPGHSLAALAAYPVYSCTGGPFKVATTWGVFEDIFCTREETFQFLEDILDEVCHLFPGKYIHIGGDEAPKARWKSCPICQLRIQEEGLKDEHELQSYFIRRIGNMLHKREKKFIGWDEILEGGLAPSAAVMSWRGEEGGIAAAQMGHDVVMTPGFVMYFDHYQGDPKKEPLAICCLTPLEKVYAYDPVPASLNQKEQQHIMGVQANVWTEYIKTSSHTEYMVNPRLFALSEIAWTRIENKNLDGFRKRVVQHYRHLDRNGIRYRRLDTNTTD